MIILDDFTLIKHKFLTAPYINVYPLGDVHIGSKECNTELLDKWITTVKNDPFGYVVIIGDLMNMGLKNAKSNIYEEVLTPQEQKEKCFEVLNPIADKILAGCSGNHEYRANREVGMNPLYDVFCRLRIEDRYRQNACFLKLTVGSHRAHPNTYGLVLTHGKSKNRDLDWTYSVDGADVFISGHTHIGTHHPMGKIQIDMHHDTVKTIGYQHIVVLPFQEYGGYSISNKYKPNHLGQFQCVQLDGTKKQVNYAYS